MRRFVGVSTRERASVRFEELYRAHASSLLGYALRRVERPEDAVDALAETMLVAWRRGNDVPPGDEARLWLFGVARRVLANQRRGSRRRSRLGERLRDDLVSRIGPDPIAAADTNLLVETALARLDPEDRELLRLTAWEGLGPQEIAVVTSVPPGTVRSRLHRARNRLRAELGTLGWDSSEHIDRPGHVGHDEQALVRNTEDDS